ncbi:MAG: PDZ domain-containing protein [Candidatus Obscuribacterales bacterium]|nr:PDZ domain-containing protein [Candidatus Obscuribacterales bacterium]
MQPIIKVNPRRVLEIMKESMSLYSQTPRLANPWQSYVSRGLLPAALLVSLLLAQVVTPPAFADDEILLKPDVPKMDMPVEAPKKTLKGNVQHSHKQADPNRKPLSAGASGSGTALGTPGIARPGAPRRSNLKAQAKNNMLDASAFAGIGIIGVKFEMIIGRPPTIKIVFAGTPASDEGIRPNDVIVAVDGIPTYGLTKEEVYDLIVGTPHTPVTLSLQRGGDFAVKRLTRMDFNEIPDPQVKADYLKSM